MPLTDTACKNAKGADKPFKMSDGGGLFLLVKPHGSKLWQQAYRLDGKHKLLSHGLYPTVSLQDAHARRDAVKALLADGTDPSEARKAGKNKGADPNETFAAVAKEWFDNRKTAWTERYATRLWNRLEADIIPAIGSKAVSRCLVPAFCGLDR